MATRAHTITHGNAELEPFEFRGWVYVDELEAHLRLRAKKENEHFSAHRFQLIRDTCKHGQRDVTSHRFLNLMMVLLNFPRLVKFYCCDLQGRAMVCFW